MNYLKNFKNKYNLEKQELKPIPKSRTPWNYGKRKPERDDTGYLWCACLYPKLISNNGGRGQAYCLLCRTPWYH